jgi:Outer membrane protein beta-barrel domain
MRSTLSPFLFILAAPVACLAQQWEFGGTGGYGWSTNPSISNSSGSAEAGFPSRGTIGAVLGENLYQYVSGEVRYLFQFGGPELRLGGTLVNTTGYTNLVTYDVLVHMTRRSEKLRPFIAGGAGIKVYTDNGICPVDQPLSGFARLTQGSEVEPAISVGAGLKYRLTSHAQARIDFRTYFSPLPGQIFRTSRLSPVHGWAYDLVPMAGISYVFGGR